MNLIFIARYIFQPQQNILLEVSRDLQSNKELVSMISYDRSEVNKLFKTDAFKQL